MAYLIPENIPSRNDVPESVQTVAGSFRDLVDDEVTVWLESDGAGDPTLLVLDPEAGLLSIEAPSQTTLGIRRSAGLFKRRNKAPRLDDVMASAHERAQMAEKLLAAEKRLGASVPTASTAALAMLSREDFDRLELDEDADDYLLKEDFSSDALRSAMKRLLGVASERPLTEPEERLVRGTLKPEIVILNADDDDEVDGQVLFRPPECDPEDAIKVLDRQQERLAHHLGDGYRVVRGVAGSGKSLVLIHRARYLAEHFPQHEFLLVCFNRPLAMALADQVSAYHNVTVKTLDSLAGEIANLRPKSSDEWTQQREAAAKMAQESSKWSKYNAVFVDEAQDLDPPALDLAYASLRDDSDAFVIALDGAQNIYRKNARWNPPNTTARGRTTFLRTCYRNTKEIAEFAWGFLQEAGIGELSEDTLDDPTLVIPPESTSRKGPKPTVLQSGDADDEVEAVFEFIVRQHDSGIPWGQIAVLYGTHKKRVFPLLKRLRDSKIPELWVSDFKNRNRRNEVISAGDVVRVATMQGLKGLEFSRVALCGVNDIYDAGADDETHKRKLAYVAMTRAMDELMITVSGEGPIGRAIQTAST